MELRKGQLKNDKKCNMCKKSLNSGEYAYYDPKEKVVYCSNCAKKISDKQDVETPENINLIAKLDDLALQVMHFNSHMQVIHVDLLSIRERLDKIENMKTKPAATKKSK